MLGLGIITPSPNKTTEWQAEKYLNLPGGAAEDYARVTNFSNHLGRISGTGSDDVGDNITLSFWVAPIWVMGAVGNNQYVESSGGNQNGLDFPVFGDTSTEKDRIRFSYLIDTGGGSDRNRFQLQKHDASNNKEMEEFYLHSGNNSVTGVGSTLSSSGITSGWWHSTNKGNTNSSGFVHLCFTRGTGDWSAYWNGAALGAAIDADSGTVALDESNIDEFWLGKSFLNQSCFKMGYRDIAYFNRALDATEAAELYNDGNLFDVRTHSQSQYLGLYWPCNDEHEISGAGPTAKLELLGNASFKVF